MPLLVFPWYTPHAAAPHTSSPRQPSLGNQPAIDAELNGLSPFFLFLCPVKAFPPFCSFIVSPHTCFSLRPIFLWPHLGMASSHLLTLSSYGQPSPSTQNHLQRAVLPEHFVLPGKHCQHNKQIKTLYQVTQKPACHLCLQLPLLMH